MCETAFCVYAHATTFQTFSLRLGGIAEEEEEEEECLENNTNKTTKEGYGVEKDGETEK